MQKLTNWIFAFVAASLLVYAYVRYGHVRQEIFSAQMRLEELRTVSARLEEDNAFLSYQIGSQGNVPVPDGEGEDTEPLN